MAQVYFHCSNPEGALIDHCGVDVSGFDEVRDRAACIVRTLITAPSLEDWRNWALHVSDDLGNEMFVLPFAFMLGKPH
jgi:hypothetical protein